MKTDASLKYRTLKGELVRSLSEKFVADFFYSNGIKYEYERPLVLDGEKIKPDFYLPTYNTYVEFWGLLEDSNYFNAFKWKVEKYNSHKIRFIPLRLEDLPVLEKNFETKLKTVLGTLRRGDGRHTENVAASKTTEQTRTQGISPESSPTKNFCSKKCQVKEAN
jgi:hypothetical protein